MSDKDRKPSKEIRMAEKRENDRREKTLPSYFVLRLRPYWQTDYSEVRSGFLLDRWVA